MIITEKEITVVPVDLHDEQVQILIAKLDRYQALLYGLEHCNLDSVEDLQKSHAYILGAYVGDKLAGIGAVKLLTSYGEIKRMFVEKEYHRSGVAGLILNRLEAYIIKHNRAHACLETGNLQYAAIRFYKKNGYTEIERFGGYQPNGVSIYFLKEL